MNASPRKVVLIWGVPILSGIALATGLAWPGAIGSRASAEEAARGPVQRWAKLSVELPTSEASFPPGDGAEITGQCLICHSAGMVLRQPPLTKDEWTAEINKMRNAFGAPLPSGQVEALARYLYRINGRKSAGGPSAVDEQGG
jgi:mono/diheme cytochrome c family protein